jgi:hypothetical protein
MKFLISESGECKRWNGDISTLEPGLYFLAKKVETIRIVGGENSDLKSLKLNKTIEIDDDDETAGFLQSPNNDKSVGKIHYWKGLRYCKNTKGKLERFEAGDEPQMVNGELFSGSYISGKFKWDTNEPSFEDGALPEAEPVRKEKVKKTKVKDIVRNYSDDEASVEECLAIAAKITDQDKKPKAKTSQLELAEEAVADAESIDDFDDAAFLEDMSSPDVNQEANCTLSEDSLTLIVNFEGGKYQKRFKTTSVASSQMKMFEEYLKNDRALAKELLSGSISTFRKV